MLVNVGLLNDYTSSQNDSGPIFTHSDVIINFPCYNIFYDVGPFSSNYLKSIHIDHIYICLVIICIQPFMMLFMQ
jgi:hypothetical protein